MRLLTADQLYLNLKQQVLLLWYAASCFFHLRKEMSVISKPHNRQRADSFLTLCLVSWVSVACMHCCDMLYSLLATGAY